MKKLSLIILAVLMLSGCGNPLCIDKYETDQTQRQEIFKECLQLIPEGPTTTHYNDWAEVVDSCESAAYYQAKVKLNNCQSNPKPNE